VACSSIYTYALIRVQYKLETGQVEMRSEIDAGKLATCKLQTANLTAISVIRDIRWQWKQRGMNLITKLKQAIERGQDDVYLSLSLSFSLCLYLCLSLSRLLCLS